MHDITPERVPTPEAWEELGLPSPGSLADDRIQLHHAVQLLASFGQTLVPARNDDSHRSVSWDPARRLFLSEPTPRGLRLGLDPAKLTVRLLGGEGEREREAMALRGRSLEEAYAWLEAGLGAAAGGDRVTVGRPEFEIPGHAVGEGAPFSPGSAGLAELARWFHDAHLALEEVRRVEPRASAVRCWPHHFDMATLVVVEGSDEPDEVRTVGLGLSPGDGSYPEPYWYGNPWPRPEPDGLPDLPGPGRWHTEGWVGAVLPGTELVASGDGTEQARAAAAFLDSALRAGLAIVRG